MATFEKLRTVFLVYMKLVGQDLIIYLSILLLYITNGHASLRARWSIVLNVLLARDRLWLQRFPAKFAC